MRLPITLFACALLTCAAGGGAAAATFPYKAFVAADDVFVRSGPGENYYPTDKLKTGDAVEVYRHDPGGWCAIRPVPASFSWVSTRYLRLGKGNIATVTEEHVAARVGSRFSDVRDVIEVWLHRGELVEVLDAGRDGPAASANAWCKIAPPAGEFRWISSKFLDANFPRDGLRKSSDDDRWHGAHGRPPASQPQAGGVRTMSAEQFEAEVVQLDLDLSMVVAEEPSIWRFDDLRTRSEALLDHAETAVERSRAGCWSTRSPASRRSNNVTTGSTPCARNQTGRIANQRGEPAAAGGFAAVGRRAIRRGGASGAGDVAADRGAAIRPVGSVRPRPLLRHAGAGNQSSLLRRPRGRRQRRPRLHARTAGQSPHGAAHQRDRRHAAPRKPVLFQAAEKAVESPQLELGLLLGRLVVADDELRLLVRRLGEESCFCAAGEAAGSGSLAGCSSAAASAGGGSVAASASANSASASGSDSANSTSATASASAGSASAGKSLSDWPESADDAGAAASASTTSASSITSGSSNSGSSAASGSSTALGLAMLAGLAMPSGLSIPSGLAMPSGGADSTGEADAAISRFFDRFGFCNAGAAGRIVAGRGGIGGRGGCGGRRGFGLDELQLRHLLHRHRLDGQLVVSDDLPTNRRSQWLGFGGFGGLRQENGGGRSSPPAPSYGRRLPRGVFFAAGAFLTAGAFAASSSSMKSSNVDSASSIDSSASAASGSSNSVASGSSSASSAAGSSASSASRKSSPSSSATPSLSSCSASSSASKNFAAGAELGVAVVDVIGLESERADAKLRVRQQRRHVNAAAVEDGAVGRAQVAKDQQAVFLGQFAVLAADHGMGDGQPRLAAATDDRWQLQDDGRLVGLSADDNEFGFHGEVTARASGERACNYLSYSEAAAAATTRFRRGDGIVNPAWMRTMGGIGWRFPSRERPVWVEFRRG